MPLFRTKGEFFFNLLGRQKPSQVDSCNRQLLPLGSVAQWGECVHTGKENASFKLLEKFEVLILLLEWPREVLGAQQILSWFGEPRSTRRRAVHTVEWIFLVCMSENFELFSFPPLSLEGINLSVFWRKQTKPQDSRRLEKQAIQLFESVSFFSWRILLLPPWDCLFLTQEKLLGGGKERVGGRNHSQGWNFHVLSITQVSFKVFCFVFVLFHVGMRACLKYSW